MNTKCEKCVFALTGDGHQTGCFFDIPETIVTQYASVYNKKQTLVETSSGFWKLMNFTCPLALTTQAKEYLTSNGVDANNIGNTMLELTRHKYYLVYFLDDNLDTFETNLEQLSKHFCKPSYISFVKKTTKHTPLEIMGVLNKYNMCQWKLHDIVEPNLTDSEIIDMILDTNLGTQDTKALSVWYNDCYLPADYFDKINETMNYFLNKPAYVTANTDGFNGLFLPFAAYTSNHNKINLTLQTLKEDHEVHQLCVL
jgi:hypothetical protein